MRTVVSDLTKDDIERGLKNFDCEEMKDITYTITSEQIKMYYPSTTFCNVTRSELITLEDIHEKLNTIVKICKDKKLKLKNLAKIKKYISENYLDYASKIAIKQYLFDKLKANIEVIKENGIRMGYSDNIQFKVAIEPYLELQRINTTKFGSLYTQLEATLNDILQSEEQQYTITEVYL